MIYFQNEIRTDAPYDWLIYYDPELGMHVLGFNIGQGDNHMKIKLSLSKKALTELHEVLSRNIDQMLTAPNKAVPTAENMISINSTSSEGE